MPRQGRAGPMAPLLAHAFVEDLRRDSEVKVCEARAEQKLWRKGATYVSRSGESTEAHQMAMNQRIRHRSELL